MIRENIVEEVKATARSVASAVLPSDDTDDARQAAIQKVLWFLLGALQILGLWALNIAGNWVIEKTAVPIPGNLIGMVLLYALLAAGIVKLSWFEPAGSFLIRHLAFFFESSTFDALHGSSDLRYRISAVLWIWLHRRAWSSCADRPADASGGE